MPTDRKKGDDPPPAARPGPIFFETAAAFRAWLTEHAAAETELLVGYHKVGSGRPSLTWPESVDEALCFGWIDGVRRRIDEPSYSIRFTPRKKGSIWSAVNIAKVEALTAAGRMQPAGLAAYALRTEQASRIYAYEQPDDTPGLTADERRQFERATDAWWFFEATPPGYRRVITYWVVSAKRPETRARRLAHLIDACARRIRLR